MSVLCVRLHGFWKVQFPKHLASQMSEAGLMRFLGGKGPFENPFYRKRHFIYSLP